MFEVLKECFSVNLKDYDKLAINLEINKVILVAFIAFILGDILFNLYRSSIKLTVTQLARHNAKSEDNAKTISEIGLAKNRIVKWMLSRENLLTKIVGRKGEKKYGYEEYKSLSNKERKEICKFDIDTAEFYIREEKSDLAVGIMEKYSTSVKRTIAECVFIAMICVCVIACMPGLLELINNLLRNI